jgi:hypothetical protein
MRFDSILFLSRIVAGSGNGYQTRVCEAKYDIDHGMRIGRLYFGAPVRHGAGVASLLSDTANPVGPVHALARPSVPPLADSACVAPAVDPKFARARYLRWLGLDWCCAVPYDRRSAAFGSLAHGVSGDQRSNLREEERPKRCLVFQLGCNELVRGQSRAVTWVAVLRCRNDSRFEKRCRRLQERSSAQRRICQVRCCVSTYRRGFSFSTRHA